MRTTSLSIFTRSSAAERNAQQRKTLVSSLVMYYRFACAVQALVILVLYCHQKRAIESDPENSDHCGLRAPGGISDRRRSLRCVFRVSRTNAGPGTSAHYKGVADAGTSATPRLMGQKRSSARAGHSDAVRSQRQRASRGMGRRNND